MSVVDWSKDPERCRRVRHNIRLLYHGTDLQCGSAILLSQQMHRGPYGWGGPGIYFATSAASACNLSRRHGFLLEAEVRLGKTKRITPPRWGLTFEYLAECGYDSVTYEEQGNDLVPETVYAVYHTDPVRQQAQLQVLNIRAVPWVGDPDPVRLYRPRR